MTPRLVLSLQAGNQQLSGQESLAHTTWLFLSASPAPAALALCVSASLVSQCSMSFLELVTARCNHPSQTCLTFPGSPACSGNVRIMRQAVVPKVGKGGNSKSSSAHGTKHV